MTNNVNGIEPIEFLIDYLEERKSEVGKVSVAAAITDLTADSMPERKAVDTITGRPLVLVGGGRVIVSIVLVFCAIIFFCCLMEAVSRPQVAGQHLTVAGQTALVVAVFDRIAAKVRGQGLLHQAIHGNQLSEGYLHFLKELNGQLEPKKYLYVVHEVNSYDDRGIVSIIQFDYYSGKIILDKNDRILIQKVQRYDTWKQQGWAQGSLARTYENNGFKVDGLLHVPKYVIDDFYNYERHKPRYYHWNKEEFDKYIRRSDPNSQPIPLEDDYLHDLNNIIEDTADVINKMDTENYRELFSAAITRFKGFEAMLTAIRRRLTLEKFDIRFLKLYAGVRNGERGYLYLIGDAVDAIKSLDQAKEGSVALRASTQLTINQSLLNLFDNVVNFAKTKYTEYVIGEYKAGEHFARFEMEELALDVLISIGEGFKLAAQVGAGAALSLTQLYDSFSRCTFRYVDKNFRDKIIRLTVAPGGSSIEELIPNTLYQLQQLARADAPAGRKMPTAVGRAELENLYSKSEVPEPEFLASQPLMDIITADEIEPGTKYAFYTITTPDNTKQVYGFTWDYFQKADDNYSLFHIADGSILDLPNEPIKTDGTIKVESIGSHYKASDFQWTVRSGNLNNIVNAVSALVSTVVEMTKRKRRTQAQMLANETTTYLGSLGSSSAANSSSTRRRGRSQTPTRKRGGGHKRKHSKGRRTRRR